MFKYLIFDLDGTLLDSKKQISNSSLNAINLIRQKRKETCIILCSGRHFREILPYSHILSLRDNDKVISSDGLYVNNAITGRIIWHGSYLTQTDVASVFKLTKTKCVSIFTNEHDYVFTNRKMIYFKYKILLAIGKTRAIPLMDINTLPNNIEKLIVHGKNFAGLQNSIHEINESTEMLASGISKYNALLQLERQKQINLSQSIYFGDDMNDLECFENLQYTVAMENANSIIREKALYITNSNNSDGISKALMHYFPEIFSQN